jgi:hypothetical protein
MVPPTNAAWHSRDILPILRFGETSWDAGSTSETYGPGTLPDRGPVGIESETTQTGRLRHPAGGALLTRGSQIPASSVARTTCGKRHIACKRPHEEHQFSATISETRFSHWRRPHASIDHAAGAAAVGMFLRLRAARQEKLRCHFSTQSAPT